ncbi:hypothetical protein Hanom_Chr08g00689241 [Helianthus anomalus]
MTNISVFYIDYHVVFYIHSSTMVCLKFLWTDRGCSRAESNRADLCSCLARFQTEPSGAAHLKPSIKSSEHFSSSKNSERASSEVRAIWTTVSPNLNLLRERVTMLGLKFLCL